MRLSGKRVLITGTSGGQGAAAASVFAREGARVVGCGGTAGAAERTAEALRAEGLDVTGHTVDLTDPDAARAWVDDAAAALGGIDVLYNNAGRAEFAPFAEMTLELWRTVLTAELDIVFHVTRPAWPHLQRSGNAAVINTASIAALRGLAPMGQAAHAAAKGGVVALTRALAAEGAEDGIRVNAISPGFVSTPATDAAVDADMFDVQMGTHLIRRPGQPEEIAHLALYLAGDDARWVTGQNVSIDGGATAGFR